MRVENFYPLVRIQHRCLSTLVCIRISVGTEGLTYLVPKFTVDPELVISIKIVLAITTSPACADCPPNQRCEIQGRVKGSAVGKRAVATRTTRRDTGTKGRGSQKRGCQRQKKQHNKTSLILELDTM